MRNPAPLKLLPWKVEVLVAQWLSDSYSFLSCAWVTKSFLKLSEKHKHLFHFSGPDLEKISYYVYLTRCVWCLGIPQVAVMAGDDTEPSFQADKL